MISAKCLNLVWIICGAMAMSFCLQNSYKVKISGPITVDSDWIELRPDKFLKVDKDLQMVLLDLEPPFKDDTYDEGKGPLKGKGILLPNGEVINPDIEVLDRNGNKFSLVYSGSRNGAAVYDLPYPGRWPKDGEFKTIRLRSSTPIKCKGIYWFCESTKDWK